MEAQEFRGVFTALVTPFNIKGEVDEEGLREVTRFQIENGVNGLFVCGSTGEGPLMATDQRKFVAERVIDEVSNRITVIVHVGSTNTEEAVKLAKHAEDVGADAVGAITPYYYKPDLEGLYDYYRLISESVEIPVFIYNMPTVTGFNVTPDMVAKICTLPNVIGIKDSGRNLIQVREIIETVPRKIVVINGSDNLAFPALMIGAYGQISGNANAAPELFVELYRHFRNGDYAKALEFQEKINRLIRVFEGFPPIAPIKAAMELRGIRAGLPKSPLRPLRPEETEALKLRLSKLNLYW
ncbi:MAG: 4-hydroxy-tetrahydrodipicolinate synthase [Nitrososphaerota archaeon]|nr:4-hydroxy-tetrahydrodipicolinate synthase [Candidatus Bathyarchaeota archaeon]MDW8049209.1 4-hydroxy-tetrahydrodipicolinate synthase [Nitrososphaerota archaeon]